MIKMGRFMGFLAISAVCASSSCAAPMESNLKVMWTTNIIPYFINSKVSKISEFSGLLDKDWDESLTVVLRKNGSARKINTCKALLGAFYGKGVDRTIPAVDYSNMLAWRVSCGALKRMHRLAPSKYSYVNFNIKPILSQLSSVRIPSKYGPTRLFFKSLQNIKNIKCEPDKSCMIKTDEEEFLLMPLALGDYNQDGIQDLMLQANSSPIGGGGSSSVGVIVTRNSPNGNLELLNWW